MKMATNVSSSDMMKTASMVKRFGKRVTHATIMSILERLSAYNFTMLSSRFMMYAVEIPMRAVRLIHISIIVKATSWLSEAKTHLGDSLFTTNMYIKDGMNLEFNLNRISNRISSKFRIQIEYEYSVASNSI